MSCRDDGSQRDASRLATSCRDSGRGSGGTDYNVEAISAWILRQLGGGVITVELTNCQLADAVEESLSEFNRKKARIMIGSIPLVEVPPGIMDPLFDARPTDYTIRWYYSQNVFSARYRLKKYGRGVFECSPGEKYIFDWSTTFGFPIPLEQQRFGLAFDEYEAYLMWQEEVKRVMSADFDWRWEEPFLYVSNCPAYAKSIYYTYWEDYELINIPVSWRKWVKEYALAIAKGILARIRGKFQQIPSPGGGISLDAQDLQSQSDTEKEKLLEQLENSVGDHLPPSWG